MHVIELLHKAFRKELPTVHQTRLKSLMAICRVASKTSKLFLTGLGRELRNRKKTASNIEKVNRLLGNGLLLNERSDFYRVMTRFLVQEGERPWIHVDWTCINPKKNLYALRASISMKGRSIVLYEESHPKKKENNRSVHNAFLDRLKQLLPENVTPVIVTDAGFRSPWFLHLYKLGWDFVGRLRGNSNVRIGTSEWSEGSKYHEKATGKPSYLGQGKLTKDKEVNAHFVLYKGKNKGRHKFNINKKITKKGRSKLHSKANNEPWMLVTSLEDSKNNPHQIINIYSQRMRIEENIRDTKCNYYGLGLKKSLTQSAERMNILLLIAAIATFAAWIAGLSVTAAGKAADYQAHSAKFTSSLSIVFLGREAFKRGFSLGAKQFNHALKILYQLTSETQLERCVCL